MSADFDTDLERRLTELERTTSHVHLRDPAAIRRRGRQRARRQAAGAVAAALAVVGIGAAAVTGLDRAAVPEPAGPLPTTTAEPLPGPSWSWSIDQPVEGTLPATALPPVGPYGEAEPWTDGDVTSADEQVSGRTACGDTGLTGSNRASMTTIATSLDALLRQEVFAYDDLETAQAAYESWQRECAEVAQVVGQPIPLGPMVAGTAEPADQEYTGALSSTLWLPGTNVVVVVDVVGNIGPADLDDLDDGVARAVERLAESVDRVMGDRATGS